MKTSTVEFLVVIITLRYLEIKDKMPFYYTQFCNELTFDIIRAAGTILIFRV